MITKVDSVRDSIFTVSTTRVPKQVPARATRAQGSNPSPKGRVIIRIPTKPSRVTAFRVVPTTSPRNRPATTTMIKGRENWIVTVSPIAMWISAKKKQRLPANPTTPRVRWRSGFCVRRLRNPTRHTTGKITIRPDRNRTNTTSNAGRVWPRCLTSDAMTISRNAPTATQPAP